MGQSSLTSNLKTTIAFMLIGLIGWAIVTSLLLDRVDKHFGHDKAARPALFIMLPIWLGLLGALPFLGMNWVKFGFPASLLATAYMFWSQYFGDANKEIRAQEHRDATIATRGQTKPYWQVAALHQSVQYTLDSFVAAWPRGDETVFASFMSARMSSYHSLVMNVLKNMNRRIVTKRKIEIRDVTALSADGDAQEWFEIEVWVDFDDTMSETVGPKIETRSISGNQSAVWRFIRQNDAWLFDDTRDTDYGYSALDEDSTDAMRSFAAQNQLAYNFVSETWFLPAHGYVFPKGPEDVNVTASHAIMAEGGTVIHMYDVVKPAAGKNDVDHPFFVGQIQLPKSYTNIIVVPSNDLLDKIRLVRFKQIHVEWGEFNNKYHVFIEGDEQLPTLELLNPRFIADLYDTSTAMTLQVSGTTATFIIETNEHDTEFDGRMLNLLKQAAHELAQ